MFLLLLNAAAWLTIISRSSAHHGEVVVAK